MASVWREVGDRVWIRRYEALDQTIGVIGGGSSLLVIDTRGSHVMADELLTDLKQLPGLVRFAVNTHGHWDHVFGNARFRSWPIIGHVRCAEMIDEHGEAARARLIERYSAETAGQFREVELTPPTEVFEDSLAIELDERQVELRYLGRGHTDNDIVVSVPDAAVLFGGDLLENAPAPWFGDSYPIAWADTGRALLDLVDGVVVPGHGDPFDVHFAQTQVEQLAELADLARQANSGAIGLDEAIRRSPFPPEPTAEALERAHMEIASE